MKLKYDVLVKGRPEYYILAEKLIVSEGSSRATFWDSFEGTDRIVADIPLTLETAIVVRGNWSEYE